MRLTMAYMCSHGARMGEVVRRSWSAGKPGIGDDVRPDSIRSRVANRFIPLGVSRTNMSATENDDSNHE